jgi:DNA-binding response OmpR family regulator
MSFRILVAEDEPGILNFVKKGLLKAGMAVECVETVEGIETALMTHEFDLLVLDRMLRNQDSLTRLSEFRRQYPHQKVIVLSGKTEIEDRVVGLNRGADDYLSKPFHLEELIARIRALLRRENATFKSDDNIEFEDLRLDLSQQLLCKGDTVASLTHQEFKILNLLMAHPNKIFSKEELIERVWDSGLDAKSNIVEAAMSRLRQRINCLVDRDIIHSKKGAGYWLGRDPQR